MRPGLPLIAQLVLRTTCEVAIITPILQVGKLRHQELKQLAQSEAVSA